MPHPGRRSVPESRLLLREGEDDARRGQEGVRPPPPAVRGLGGLVPGRGESLKTLAVVEKLVRAFLRRGADRETTIVAVGGGALCDVVGLASSLFMRGLPFGLVPTTLLAQVDAAVGGKNGVNVDGYKNLAGTVRQPDFVLADPDFLATLDPAEIRNGLAEVVKAAAVADAGLVGFLERNASAAAALDPAVVGRLVVRSIRIKVRIVEGDELEAGPRRLLNFGHTLGHALEREAGFSHGRAIAVGMAAAAPALREAGPDPSG